MTGKRCRGPEAVQAVADVTWLCGAGRCCATYQVWNGGGGGFLVRAYKENFGRRAAREHPADSRESRIGSDAEGRGTSARKKLPCEHGSAPLGQPSEGIHHGSRCKWIPTRLLRG